MNVEFIGPPPTKQPNTKHAVIADNLRRHPSVWGVVRRAATTTRAASAAQAIRDARLTSYAPVGSFEAVARTVVEGGIVEHRVYARYVGGEQ
ncbi:hypothetical protein GCM10010329_17140 [Streptomyces spiroverticillatus]|uniref:Uncharacterized protein n=1 Tax=Streptomyces finlayi TaxID=67296 RepID=A0A918WU65_9ACTN|nr:hypothetical protein [Streptomyces finlayi]GGZ96502.1 hypothetical protein GCM10010329_17140 [Streptomyces spiroverticillatus]GHC81868.1 hypothetical protein GCM10010334_09620 [Streptomyces finlayi]